MTPQNGGCVEAGQIRRSERNEWTASSLAIGQDGCHGNERRFDPHQVAHYETGQQSPLITIHPAEVFARAPVGIAVSDARGRIVEANRCLADLLGYDTGELAGRDLLSLVHGDDAAEVRTHVNRLLAGGVPGVSGGVSGVPGVPGGVSGVPGGLRLEPRLVRRDGAVLWVMLAVSLVRDRPGDAGWLVVTAQDVTDRYRRQLQLLHKAYHDPLTGLPNRAAFAERIHQQLFRTAVPECLAALCFLDLDGFKAVNDRLGHHVGDRLLAAVAGRLHGKVAPQGHLLARLGGDEFVILIGHQARPGTAIQVAGDVLRALERPFSVGAHKLRVSASIGVVEKPAAATSPTELLWAADLTMRRAKAGGKGRWTLFDADTEDHIHTNHLNR
jgi:diguanylate cyclase (GGDEF)-like protein